MRPASVLVAALVLLAPACRLEHAESGRPPGAPTIADSLAKVEQDSTLDANVLASLREFYTRVGARDWRAVRGTFYPGGTVTTRIQPAGERNQRVIVQSAEEFVRRQSEGPGRMPVFTARMLHAHVTGYGDVADAWVIAERRWGRSSDSLQGTRSIDAFHLYRERGLWRISDLTFTPELASRPLEVPQRRTRATPASAARRSAP